MGQKSISSHSFNKKNKIIKVEPRQFIKPIHLYPYAGSILIPFGWSIDDRLPHNLVLQLSIRLWDGVSLSLERCFIRITVPRRQGMTSKTS